MNPTWEDIRRKISVAIAIDGVGCWVWQKPLTYGGYGRMYGRPAHCLAYEAWIGPIARGLDIDHLCRNRACVNPDHLEPVTRRENLVRGIRAGQQKEAAAARTHCAHNHLLTAENTYIRPSDSARLCRTCRAAQDKRDRAKNKEVINARKRQRRRANQEGIAS